MTLTVSINSNANSLPAGSYSDTMTFTNTTNGQGNTTRTVTLDIFNPGTLEVTPTTGLSSSGPIGGPFSPSSQPYALQNTGGVSLNWTVSNSAVWVSLSKTSGTLSRGASDTVTVSINSNANSLPAGNYSDTVYFTNMTNGVGNTTRTVSLNVTAITETISTPNTPSGVTSGSVNTTYTFTTGGSVSSLGHSVQYLFDWGDGTDSGWLPVDTTSAQKSWGAPGTYNVRAQARCAVHTSVISSWSNPLAVNISSLPPVISLSRTRLNFGAFSASEYKFTSSQAVIISNAGGGTLNWVISADAAWITVNPSSGAGTAVIEIGVNHSGLSPGTYTGTITVTATGASNSPQVINLTLNVYDSGAVSDPFGYFDTPADRANVFGSVPVTGWVLDDIEVTKAEIKRAPHELDNPVVIGPDGLVYIGDAVFVEGARPDVEQVRPSSPLNYRAGWGYMLLTNFLPNQGNGTYTLYAIAHDKDGHRVVLGSKTIISDNAHSVLPFGTIDTPAQGGMASGSTYINFGWALTPQPNKIPEDGSTILVWVDGLPVGRPVYNQYRADIATLFPGYANSNGAVGYYSLNTTAYAN